jgi:hypothetical protein
VAEFVANQRLGREEDERRWEQMRVEQQRAESERLQAEIERRLEELRRVT